jgi:hypothetical protein
MNTNVESEEVPSATFEELQMTVNNIYIVL